MATATVLEPKPIVKTKQPIPKPKPIVMAFKEWTTQQLEKKLNLHRVRHCDSLEAWLKSPGVPLTDATKKELEELRDELDIYAPYWNEDELKWYFVSHLFRLINFKSPHYHLFINRTLKAKVGQYEMSGRVDAVIASGKFEPEAPFYCFHEYKREKGSADDPIAQLLSAMLVGRKLNDHNKPLYGTYIIGRLWFFVTLVGDHYCISNGHIASNNDIFEIYRIVSSLKEIIEKRLAQK